MKLVAEKCLPYTVNKHHVICLQCIISVNVYLLLLQLIDVTAAGVHRPSGNNLGYSIAFYFFILMGGLHLPI